MQGILRINLTSIVNVSFVHNVAPYFSELLKDINSQVNSNLTFDFPPIFDPDSPSAFIQQLLTFPRANFVLFNNTKQKTGSKLSINPTKDS